jgi:nitrite reductase (NADH) small subunit
MSARDSPTSWTPVCVLGRLASGQAVSALVGGRHVAVFCVATADDESGSPSQLFAIDQRDPVDRSGVLARGTVGCDRGGRCWVTSPSGSRRFDLHTGDCLDQPGCSVGVWRVRTRRGMIEVAPPVSHLTHHP